MKFYISLLSLLLGCGLCHARTYQPEILSALKYLESTQATRSGDYEPGQWATEVTAILLPSMVGVGAWGKPYPEATIFTTASIVGVLQEMQDSDPTLRQIGPMVEKAIDGFAPFYMEPFFNFYPPRKRNGAWVRGPRSMFLAPYFRGLAHIPPDADSTSVTYWVLRGPVPETVVQTFARIRDVDRKPHSYNRRSGNVNTGAFMTWLMDEKDPDMPHRFWQPELGPRIPFGTNDVDCIVNANVLKLLTRIQRDEIPGYKESCEFLKKSIRHSEYGRCGIYYPNDFMLAMSVGELKQMKASCTASEEPTVLRYLLETQSQDGSWMNAPPARPDRIQATVAALNSLLLLGDSQNSVHRKRVHKAVNYLLAHSRRNRDGHLNWRGQVFFSAVAQARFSVVWRSTPYTTALAAMALQRAERFLD
ncbi:hypothetical protein [Bdellovibrio sp. HCB337]|uniref:hypothetical protein n=1 Tax=Bdellovibrio sp. HCB337 TaxID=3394358 RepID=UPI0039A7093A